jgi:ABC-type multidrug transport system fused ATPase/permease subunit
MGNQPEKKDESVRQSVSLSLGLLNRIDRVKVYLFIGAQLLTSILDTLGILLMGLVVSVGLSLTSEVKAQTSFDFLLPYLGIESLSPEQILPLSGAAVGILLLIRTVLSLTISLQTYRFLARKGSEVSATYIRRLLSAPFWWVRLQNVNDLSFALTQGVQYSVIGVLGQFIILISEICFLILLLIVLIWVNPLMAVVASLFFFGFGSIVYLRVGRHISGLSEKTTEKVVEGFQQIQNSMNLFREIFVMSREKAFEKDFKVSRYESGMLFARLNWLQLVPKFSVEVAVVLGAFFLAFTATLNGGYQNALADLAVFLGATSRLAPSALRLQQSLISIRAFAGQSQKSFQYYRELIAFESRNLDVKKIEIETDAISDNNCIPPVNFNLVSYTFFNSSESVLQDISFSIAPGETIALVGPSGSGKSTLCDLFLGLFSPSTGTAMIGGISAFRFVKSNPGLVSYLPQETLIVPGTISENIAFGLHPSQVNSSKLHDALEKSQMLDFILSTPNGVEQVVGDSGMKLSGGQKQRIGLARALYTEPKLLVLDEPTSSLDAETEDALMRALQVMHGECSILIIAHRLSTLKYADRVMYLENGRIKAIGTIDEVRKLVPRFDTQAGLQGL